MKIDKFKVEYWLNPLDDKAKYNLGSSCCKILFAFVICPGYH